MSYMRDSSILQEVLFRFAERQAMAETSQEEMTLPAPGKQAG